MRHAYNSLSLCYLVLNVVRWYWGKQQAMICMLLANDIANSWKVDLYCTETLHVNPLHSYYCKPINTDCGMKNKFIKKVKGQILHISNWSQVQFDFKQTSRAKVKYQLDQSLTTVMGSSMEDCRWTAAGNEIVCDFVYTVHAKID